MKNNENNSEYYKLYFDLCSEEFYLKDKKCLPKDVWEFWLNGMKLEMTKSISRQAWEKHKNNYNEKFKQFFNDLINKNKNL